MGIRKSIGEMLADPALPRLEQRMLLEYASGLDHAAMVRAPEALLDEAVLSAFQKMQQRRLAGEPMAHIVGRREFFGRPFATDRHVLIPRPETELLIDLALEERRLSAGKRILDIGTGSGCIAITIALESPGTRVEAVDISVRALLVAKENARRLNATVTFTHADIRAPKDDARLTGPYDLILGNLPYIAKGDPHLREGDLRFEPMLALTDGFDGLSLIEAAIRFGKERISAGGSIILEHGYNQGAAVRGLLSDAGFTEVATHRDLAGIERATLGLQVPGGAPI